MTTGSTLYVDNLGIGKPSITLYASGITLLRKITQEILNPRALAFNHAGHLFVAMTAPA
jgi:hypothetical protein